MPHVIKLPVLTALLTTRADGQTKIIRLESPMLVTVADLSEGSRLGMFAARLVCKVWDHAWKTDVMTQPWCRRCGQWADDDTEGLYLRARIQSTAWFVKAWIVSQIQNAARKITRRALGA